MSKRLWKRIAALLLTAVMVCSICLPVSAAGYGTVNSKASSVKIAATGGGDFILKKNTATITFKMKNNCQVRVYVMDAANKVVWYKDVSGVKANKSYTVKWNGKKSNGSYVSFATTYKQYRVCVRAGSTKSYSSYIKLYKKCEFAGGVGSAKDPYQVNSAAQFAAINNHPSRYYIQTADIDFEYEDIEGVGAPFSGNYNGDGHSIKNMAFLSTEKKVCVALFQNIAEKGIVQNIVFDGCSATSAASSALVAVDNYGKITGCAILNSTVSGDKSYPYGSGLICANNYGTIINCELADSSSDTGGFVYRNFGKLISVQGDHIKVERASVPGGLVYRNEDSGLVKDCHVVNGEGYWGYGEDRPVMVYENRGTIQASDFNGSTRYMNNYGVIL